MMANLDEHLGDVVNAPERSGRDWNIVLSTDHGFEPEYYSFYPARALRDADLTVTDEDGQRRRRPHEGLLCRGRRSPDQPRGRVLRRHVSKGDYKEVAVEAREALLGIRGFHGERIVKRVVRSERYNGEGLGGPHGGELHLQTFPNMGYYPSGELGPAGAPPVDRVTGGYSGWHGNRVRDNRSMQGFAVLGGDQFADGVTIERARSIDLNPTAAAAVGIHPAKHWRGNVLEDALSD